MENELHYAKTTSNCVTYLVCAYHGAYLQLLFRLVRTRSCDICLRTALPGHVCGSDSILEHFSVFPNTVPWHYTIHKATKHIMCS